MDKADLCKLCVHKLPAAAGSSSSSDAAAASVKASLAAACRQAGTESAAAAVESAAVEQPGDSSKQLLFLVFKHAGLANEVFAALPGGACSGGQHDATCFTVWQLLRSNQCVALQQKRCLRFLMLLVACACTQCRCRAGIQAGGVATNSCTWDFSVLYVMTVG